MAYKTVYWDWREAFSKFGFDDGDGWNGTDLVAEFIRSEFQVSVEADTWGCHNYMIQNITDKQGTSLIPDGVSVGYDEPDDWLPKDWVEKLDGHFHDEYQVGY